SLFEQGWTLKSTRISDTFSYDAMKSHYGDMIIPFFLFDENDRLYISTIENPIEPKSGDLVIALILENGEK
ncbi:MAG: hypothetical protein OQJ78_07460, partial [Ignavibacteriaceae bacterium]|nr:hypothetical protein [Ignavibacteriaceae bacterium]